jgi:hypothetical protein
MFIIIFIILYHRKLFRLERQSAVQRVAESKLMSVLTECNSYSLSKPVHVVLQISNRQINCECSCEDLVNGRQMRLSVLKKLFL